MVNRQIDIAKQYGIYGFATYYYWFSENTITHKHTIMEDGYKNLFKKKNYNIFFIWANENWSGNDAFNTSAKILNTYDIISFNKNINNLMRYFKHPNYYKIDNKPVFYIHHPYFLTNDEISTFDNLLNKTCIKNGFNGAILCLNNHVKQYDNNNYSCHPLYKNIKTHDYKEYIETYLNDNNKNSIFFDFNNSARLYNPNKLDKRTIFTDITIYNQDTFINTVFDTYKDKDEINKIVLINSWNEWGENMAIEPGNINLNKYLLLLKSNLYRFIP